MPAMSQPHQVARSEGQVLGIVLIVVSVIAGGLISLGMHEPNIARFVGAGIFVVGTLFLALPPYFADRRYTGKGLYTLSTGLLPLFVPAYAIAGGLGAAHGTRFAVAGGLLVLTIALSVAAYRYEDPKAKK